MMTLKLLLTCPRFEDAASVVRSVVGFTWQFPAALLTFAATTRCTNTGILLCLPPAWMNIDCQKSLSQKGLSDVCSSQIRTPFFRYG
ncbi:hypothetical protein B0H19DRAFT_1153602 [Mycena capillaripes]|nr:hypothetical protein B0H19DRAFT_1153602 [Mycena capillaripes]